MAAYLVSVCEITNPHENFKKYIKLSADLMHEYGGEYVIRGVADTVYGGDYLEGKSVIIAKFPDMKHIKDFNESEDYINNVKPLREGSGIYDIAAYEEAAG